jgi:hypothetical protein
MSDHFRPEGNIFLIEEGAMRRTAYVVLVGLAVLAAAACTSGPTVPGGVSARSTQPPEIVTTITADDLKGTWQATKVEAWDTDASGGPIPGKRRDLVAEGGTVTLALEPVVDLYGTYTITVTMPGTAQGADSGRWIAWVDDGTRERFQIDFYPDSLGPEPEYGDIPAFLVALSEDGKTLKLWDAGLTFLPYDFGWKPGSLALALEFTRE